MLVSVIINSNSSSSGGGSRGGGGGGGGGRRDMVVIIVVFLLVPNKGILDKYSYCPGFGHWPVLEFIPVIVRWRYCGWVSFCQDPVSP